VEYKIPEKLKGIRIFSSEKIDGSMSRENIGKNLPKFLAREKIYASAASPPVAYCEQVHGRDIKLINKKGFYENCDGLVTGEEIGLIIKSADCIPLLFFSAEEGMIGAIHIGWRSLQKGIILSSLKEIFQKTSLSPASTIFFLAPHIRKENYEVKQDMVDTLSPQLQKFVSPIDSKIFFDLSGALQGELESIGVKRENIIDSEIDTYSEENLFSYRRGDKGLFVTLIVKSNG
jgi:hypothetical protein